MCSVFNPNVDVLLPKINFNTFTGQNPYGDRTSIIFLSPIQ